MSKDERYHCKFIDKAAGESLGLLLVETPQVSISRHLINPYAAKGSSGYTQDSDLTEWSVIAQKDWRGGRGQEDYLENEKFLDACGLETRINGQITLGPLPQQPVTVAVTPPRYEPGDVDSFGVGWQIQEDRFVSGATAHLHPTLSTAMRFKAPAHYRHLDTRITNVMVKIKKIFGTTTVVRLGIYNSSGGLPDTELAHKEIAAGSVGTSYAWVTFTLATPLSITADTYYWIVVNSPGTVFGYSWERQAAQATTRGGARYTDGVWAHAKWDVNYVVTWTKISRSMSFTTPAAGLTCTTVQLYLLDLATMPTDTFNVKLCEDSSGAPGTVLKTKAITGSDVPSSWGWIEVEWDSGQVLAGSTVYHLMLEPATTHDQWGYFTWGGNSVGGYGDGASDLRLGSGSWTAQTEDLYFRVNKNNLNDNVIAFTRYDGSWYCAAGDSVYKWNTGTEVWDSSDQVSDKDVTDLLAWGDWLWAARGSSNILRRYNGAAWSDVSGKYANHLAGGPYFHYSDASANNTHKIYYTNDGTNWSGPIVCGTQQHGITSMTMFRDRLVAATPIRLWTVVAANDGVYPTLDWSSQEDVDNGKGMMVWTRTGALYIPLRFGLYRYNGDTMVPIGPEQGTGLPAERAGKIVKMVGTGNWLFTAINAGASGTSSILAYNGLGGWHEMMRAEATGQIVYTLGFETINSPSRLWYGLAKETRYLMLPDYSDNPWQYTGYKYNAGGELIMSWMGGTLLEVVKDLYEVVVRAENVSTSRIILVYYEVDRSGLWTLLGEITETPRQSLSFVASEFSPKTVGDSSTRTTIELDTGEITTDMAVGDWCRINAEVSQVASITDTDTFVLETALSEAPENGDTVYASLPAGREFRLKLVMSSDNEDETPLLKTVFIRYQNNVADRFAYTLQIKVADGMTDLTGNPYPYTAADLRILLDEWTKRVLPFTLIDQDGEEITVKVSAASEGGLRRKTKQGIGSYYNSVYSMNLVQVA